MTWMTFLIDGYNLMHFLGLTRPRGPKSLEKSRLDLQEWLRRTHGKAVENVTVVFDGRAFEGRREKIQNDHGLHVHFSAGETADDVIEEMIKRHPRPERLTVVSSDRRIQESARRRGCVVWSCDDYVGWVVDQGHEPPKPPRQPEKPPASAEETEHWKRAFADLDDDPELRKFNRMYKDFDKD
jgi:predicted RNA-binding protein with PIN domain